MKRRKQTQLDKIFTLLARQGRVSNSRLAGIAKKYTSRISDLRAEGWRIDCTRSRRRAGIAHYSLAGFSAAQGATA